MRNFRSYTSVLTVLLLVGIGAGCENAPQIAGPVEDAPQFAAGTGSVRTTSTPVAWTRDFTGDEASATLSSGGGTLEITDGKRGPVIVALHVPGGAAPGGPIDFKMVLACDEDLACEVQLEATRNGRAASTFLKGVELSINLSYLAPEKGTSITIAESHGGDLYTPVRTRQDGDFLIGTLSHFSAYVPITD